MDVGTQSLRVQLVDAAGTPVGKGAGALSSRRDGGRHEQDPEQWWRVLGEAFRQALADRPASRVAGLAICSTSGTFLLADADGRPRTPAFMYDDARAGDEATEVAEVGAARWSALGYPMQRSWALPKLVWLLRHGPADLRVDAEGGRLRLLHCADHLASRLTGGPVATDWSHALKTGYDLDERAWPEEVLDKLGVPGGLLPAVVRPGAELGQVGAAGAAHTGLPIGTPVLAGTTDGCAAQIAANALAPGAWNVVLGTTLVLKGVTEHRLVDPGGAVYSHRHPDGGWLPGGASNVGAGVLEARFPAADRAVLEAAAARHEPSTGVSYPLLSRGERFPFVRPDAEPFELGDLVDDGDRYAATLQGVAFVERLCFALLRRLGADVSGPLSMTGGATRSRYWTQLRADILGRDVVLPDSPEPAVGAAITAAAGDGPIAATAARMTGSGTVVRARPDRTARFAGSYARFLDALTERGWLDEDLAHYAKEAR
ncbi:FGGY family carbohydrate kinase [Micromonospora sp. DR5-3]|uniref:FGGY-family carbohydrate kinase n=1 Tax=unclassified Micromonospora TaxID=2617518 RepID=UPI0021084FDF|nr:MULTISPECIES: FGGY family carbohydrate kinase [unclassified Micromonospora]MCW3819655.1 FGGY family carbohydrate kinase [Micromonospora sp. DR5-3]